jgi:hypothetical protein
MSYYKKNQIENLNDAVKKAYKRIKDNDSGDLSIIESSTEKEKEYRENDYSSELIRGNKINKSSNIEEYNTDQGSNSYEIRSNRVISNIDALSHDLNKDFKEMEDMVNNLEKELKSI